MSRRPFAGVGVESYEFLLERSTPPDPRALDRWKELLSEGWDIEALVSADASTMVGLGVRYLDEPARYRRDRQLGLFEAAS